METTINKKLLILFVALVSWFAGYSQQYSDSLTKYLEIAAKNNPIVLQKLSEYQAALQKIPQVASLPDPQLSLGVFLKPMEIISGNQVADIKLMQMFPWFGVVKNAKDEMSLMANAKYELFRDAKFQVFYDVQETWYELYKVRKTISISEKNIEILKTIERVALVRFKSAQSGVTGTTSEASGIPYGSDQTSKTVSSGMQSMVGNQGNYGTVKSNQSVASMESSSMGSSAGSSGLADIYRLQIESNELENNIALLKNQEQSTIARFNSFLDRPPDAQVFTDGTLTTDSLVFSLIEVTDSILANNPMLSMLEYEKQSFAARGKMNTAMGYPMVGIGLDYLLINKNMMSSSSMNGNDMIMPMVTVTLPIYRKKYNAMQTEADLLVKAASQNYRATANSLQTEFYQAVQSYLDAKRRIKLYENQYQLASKSLDLMLKNFSTSSSGLTDVLRVYQQALDIELKQVEAVADFNTDIAWLKRLMASSQIQ